MNNYNTYVLGDIHGCYEDLLEVLEKVNFNYEQDHLISLGDLCDRGPKTWEVIELLTKINNLILIEGNHDQWLKTYLKCNHNIKPQIWLQNGGDTTLKSYYYNNFRNEDKHLKLLESALPYYVKDNICFVHGGFDPNFYIADQNKETLCWDREFVQEVMDKQTSEIIKTKDKFDKIFIGHTPTIYFKDKLTKKPIITPIVKNGVINIDTGCGKGAILTLWNLNTNEYVQSTKK